MLAALLEHDAGSFAGIRACSARELTGPAAESAARMAVERHWQNFPSASLIASMALPVWHPAAIHMIGKVWPIGRTIRVAFLDGSAIQKAKVQRLVNDWLVLGSLNIEWGGYLPTADARVTFRPGGSWSLIGTDCLGLKTGATLQLGWVTDDSDETSDRAVILHEFGHLFSFAHEQSSPDSDLKIDVEKTYAYFQVEQGWDRPTVFANVLARFTRQQVAGTAYDRTSIMHYPYPAQLTLDGRGIDWNTVLSALDKQHYAALYPFDNLPIVVPPVVPPPVFNRLIVGGPALNLPIPGVGLPAVFEFEIASPGRYRFSAEMSPHVGHKPLLVVTPEWREKGYPLKLDGAWQAVTPIPPGKWTAKVFNPLSWGTGTATLKLSSVSPATRDVIVA